MTVRLAGSGLRRQLWKSHLCHWHCALYRRPTFVAVWLRLWVCSVFVSVAAVFSLCDFSSLCTFLPDSRVRNLPRDQFMEFTELAVGGWNMAQHWCTVCCRLHAVMSRIYALNKTHLAWGMKKTSWCAAYLQQLKSCNKQLKRGTSPMSCGSYSTRFPICINVLKTI